MTGTVRHGMDGHEVARALGGDDPAAATALIRSTQADVYRFCARFVPRDDAADLTQEVYLRAFRSRRHYRGEAPVRAWLLGIARAVVADHLRRRARRAGIAPVELAGLAAPEQADPSADPSAPLTQDELLDALPEDQRVAFVLTQIVGLSYAEAAVACAVPVGTIRSRVARARSTLVGIHERSEHDGDGRDEQDGRGERGVVGR